MLDLVYSDVSDLKSHITYGGNQYYITFIDDYTRYAYVYLMKTKDEAFDKFKIYKAEIETQLGVKIKILHSDRGGEYFSNEFTLFRKQQGIIHQCTAPYTPQQNGVAERKNRTLVEMVNAMLISSSLPYNLRGDAMLSVCYILNRVPLKKNNISLYGLWFNRKPNLTRLKIWGFLAYVRKPDPK